MTAAVSKPAVDLVRRFGPAFLVVALIGGVTATQPNLVAYVADAGWRLKVPELGLLAGQRPAIQAHLAAAVTALVIGIVIMMRPKGVGLHKLLGWSWVVAMAATAISSFFIPSFTGSRFGMIHLLSGWTVTALPMAVAAIRRRDVASHRRAMTGIFVGGLLLAGALTFIPGRLMWRIFFG